MAAPNIKLFFSFPLLLLYFTAAKSLPLSIQQWCKTVPHPDPCLYCLSRTNFPLKTRSDFFKLSVQAALDLAVRARDLTRRLGSRCDGAAEKTAWLDCRKLFADTVIHLNRTLFSSSGADERTWLSAALTNLFTCNRGFAELNASASFMRPVMRYNVSDLISNCLAVKNESFDGAAAAAGWRGVVEAAGGADFVVAGDGSGEFRTVVEAVEAAGGMRRRMGGRGRRIVIYVKAGVYAEYVMVGSSVNDLTIRGDGKGRTIITGRRSVALGFTTFSSPTVSKKSAIFFGGFIQTTLKHYSLDNSHLNL